MRKVRNDYLLRITLKVFQKRGRPKIYCKCFKRRMHELIRRVVGEKYTLRVSYGRELSNEGEYRNKKDLKQALSAFTEKTLLDDIYAGGY